MVAMKICIRLSVKKDSQDLVRLNNRIHIAVYIDRELATIYKQIKTLHIFKKIIMNL